MVGPIPEVLAMADDDRDMGTPDKVAAALDQFRSGLRPRQPNPEEEAALGLAIEISDAETRAFITENSGTPMAEAFPDHLRENVLQDLALALSLAAGLEESWRRDTEPGDLLASARGLRDAAGALARTVERLWPNKPPPDYGRDLLGDA